MSDFLESLLPPVQENPSNIQSSTTTTIEPSSDSSSSSHSYPPIPTPKQMALLFNDIARFKRGRAIQRAGGFKECKFQGQTISARIPGNHRAYYRAKVTFAPEARNPECKQRKSIVKSWNCMCPDWGDPCKHIVALLIHWCTNPHKFTFRPALRDVLTPKSKEDLIELMEKLYQIYPQIGQIIYEEEADSEEEEEE
jgi:uncharacterized Zn finger protein